MRKKRWAVAGLVVLGLALLTAYQWQWAAPAASGVSPDVVSPEVSARSSEALPSGVEEPVASSVVEIPFSTLLLPDSGVSANSETVLIGLARVSPEDAERHDALRDDEGAQTVAEDYEDLANVEEWRSVPAKLQSDGTVEVGPVVLPQADGYRLIAQGSDRLRYYSHWFTQAKPPQTIRPLVGAGLRLRREGAGSGRASIYLRRRGETANAGDWQILQQQFSHALQGAFSDTPIPLDTSVLLLPLEAQELDVQVWVDGIEALREIVTLEPGAIKEVILDAAAEAVAQELSFDLELTFVDKGSLRPISGLDVQWVGDREPVEVATDSQGRAIFSDLDRRQAHRFTVMALPPADGRPRYPERFPLEVSVATDPALAGAQETLQKTVEIEPFRWIDVRVPAVLSTTSPTRQDAFPIFALQRQLEGEWTDQASDYFLPTPSGVSVSVAESGSYRVALALSPWQVLYSQAAQIAGAGEYPVSVTAAGSYRALVQVTADGAPLRDTSVHVRGPLRGLPAAAIQTDALGRIELESVTVPTVWIETDQHGETAAEIGAGARLVDLGSVR